MELCASRPSVSPTSIVHSLPATGPDSPTRRAMTGSVPGPLEEGEGRSAEEDEGVDDRPGPASAAYSERFLGHLRAPRGQGTLTCATHRGEAEDGVCGDRLVLDLAVAGDIVE